MLKFVDPVRAKLRADIWIHRPTGGVCREQEIDNARLAGGYCSRFYSSKIAGSRVTRRKSQRFT